MKIASRISLRYAISNFLKHTKSRSDIGYNAFLTNYKNVKQVPQNGVDLGLRLLKMGLILETLLKMSLIVKYDDDVSLCYRTVSFVHTRVVVMVLAYRTLWSLSTIRYDKPVSRSQRAYNDNSRYEKFLIYLNRSNSFFLK